MFIACGSRRLWMIAHVLVRRKETSSDRIPSGIMVGTRRRAQGKGGWQFQYSLRQQSYDAVLTQKSLSNHTRNSNVVTTNVIDIECKGNLPQTCGLQKHHSSFYDIDFHRSSMAFIRTTTVVGRGRGRSNIRGRQRCTAAAAAAATGG